MDEYFIIVGLICLGWISAKFINYYADMIPSPTHKSASICIYCGRKKPIPHYLALNYFCVYCGAPYRRRVCLVDSLTVIAILSMGLSVKDLGVFLLSWLLIIFIGITIVVDLEIHIIQREICIYGAILCFIYGYFLHGLNNTWMGGLAGFATMFILRRLGFLYLRFFAVDRVDRNIMPAIGFGDVLLSAYAGFFIGYVKIIPAIFMSIVLAGMIGIIIKGYQRYVLHSQNTIEWIPMSPFIILSAFVFEMMIEISILS